MAPARKAAAGKASAAATTTAAATKKTASARQEETRAKTDKALDAAGEPKKRLPSKAAAKEQAEVTHKEVNEPTPKKKAATNGKKRAREAADEDKDDGSAEEVQAAASPAAAKKAATTTSKKQQQSGKAKAAAAAAPASEEDEAAEAATAQEENDEEDSEEADEALDESEIIRGLSDVSGSDDDADSSDEEDDEDDVEAGKNASILTVKLPNAKDDHSVKQRLDRVAKRKVANRTAEVPATLYFGRLPHGFLEDQLRSYLSQFGDVRRLRVSRNRKTGKPKHYAFVEFADRDVAAIVQETMNNYLIDGHLLQVREVPRDKIHPKLWIGADRKYRPVPVDRLERVRRSQPKTPEQQAKRNQKLLDRQEARRQNLKAAGIDYQFEGYTIEA
ncbi:uncharacterized protein PFL1_00855 [Pseudozyma flocculosa PF-1]|uniref:uncharacterized protein n=1 Tax=Pseudozyma flocculosa PF-1 TaxID=1277687 RepID=UPI0004560F13|nr:uncharacterized protein PFL1_00855 [Pseudozyma flocculosa PF-1]EPQ31522.1 hypothetical protein PFL1_00855 [Pseudozyma flocculosa PF-1]